MRRMASVLSLAVILVWAPGGARAVAQALPSFVKITPLGSHAGELCRNDRALLLEDPTGVRILYDPGRTTDETDPRLGDVHVVLLSHAHVDHIGDARPLFASPGSCAAPAAGPANPNSNFASIAALKSSAVLAPGELTGFLGRKIQNIRSVATGGCPEAGLENIISVPLGAPCTASLRPGGSRTIVRLGSSSLVRIAVVQAVHSNGIPPALIDAPGLPPAISGYGGSEGGFVITFSTGLVVYLTGDTGMFGDMETIISRFYRPGVVVLNMSDTVTLGPNEAAFVIQNLVRPATVMPSHVNEEATAGGRTRAGTRVERFTTLVRSFADVVVPTSGVTRQFDAQGRCVDCR